MVKEQGPMFYCYDGLEVNLSWNFYPMEIFESSLQGLWLKWNEIMHVRKY